MTGRDEPAAGAGGAEPGPASGHLPSGGRRGNGGISDSDAADDLGSPAVDLGASSDGAAAANSVLSRSVLEMATMAPAASAVDSSGVPSGELRGIFSPELLGRCISCGFCLPSCPTYRVTGRESSSPRGRITLMRALESGRLPDDDPTLAEESSFCLGCRACEPVCPAGVQYGALLEEWRSHQWRRRPLLLRLLLFAVARRWRVRLLGLLRHHARSDPPRIVMYGNRPRLAQRREGASLMLGCFERAMFPGVSKAAVRVSPVLGCPPGQGCCGALHAHNGALDRGRQMARELGESLPGPIVTTSGGCAAHLASVLGRDRVYEISAWLLATSDLSLFRRLTVRGRPVRVTLQDSCHLRNGLGGASPPREILRAIADYVELPSAGSCCGAAGTYSLLRPQDARRVFEPKLREIEAADVDYVVAVNAGCLRQLQTELRRAKSQVQAIHLVELVDRAQSQ